MLAPGDPRTLSCPQTFRPAALLLEHSVDHGHSWHVDQYFAHNCSGLFPGIPPALATVSDVVCDQHYSDMEPSTEGKVRPEEVGGGPWGKARGSGLLLPVR